MTDPVSVTQEDREAAAGWIAGSPYDVVKAEAEMIRIGQLDNHRLVQAFARHRPTPDTRPAAAGLVREAAVRIERFVSMMVPQMSLTFRRNNEAEIVRMAHDFAEIRALAAAPTPDAAASEAGEVWQGIATCEGWRHDFQRPMLAYWTTRGVCETYWDTDEDFDTRPKWWPSPREGWRAPGDQCIPVNQDSVTHWMRMPAPPAAITTQGGAEG